MISSLTRWILDLLRQYGGWSVFLGVLVEQIIIPIPSPAIIMGAGALLVPAQEAWGPALVRITLHVVLPGVTASVLGAIGLYYVGAWGGKAFVDRFHRYLGFSWTDVEAAGKKISEWGGPAALFWLRALPIVPLSLISLVSGVLRMPLRPYIIWSALGSVPRCYLLGVLGWQLGNQALNWAGGVNRWESYVSLFFVAGVIGIILYLRRQVRARIGP